MSEAMSSLQGRETSTTGENTSAALPRKLALPAPALCDRLRIAMQHAAARDAESMEALRLSVCAFTAALKEEGTMPEAVLIALKSVINGGLIPPADRNHPDWSGYILRETMSTWCIDRYFSEDPA